MTLTASEYDRMLEQGTQYKCKKMGLFISSFLSRHKDKRSRTLNYHDVKLIDSGRPDLPFVTHDWYDLDTKPEISSHYKWEEAYTITLKYSFEKYGTFGAPIDEKVNAINKLLRRIPGGKLSFSVSDYSLTRIFEKKKKKDEDLDKDKDKDEDEDLELIEVELLITAESD